MTAFLKVNYYPNAYVMNFVIFIVEVNAGSMCLINYCTSFYSYFQNYI